MRVCANSHCRKQFEPRTFNHKFCTSECCKVVTNARQMQDYYENQARRRGKLRLCKDCERPLSRYNKQNICQGCSSKRDIESRDRLLELIGA